VGSVVGKNMDIIFYWYITIT